MITRLLRVLLLVAFPLATLLAALDKPVSPKALPQAQALLDYLGSIQGKYILSGQYETVDWFGVNNDTEFTWLQSKIGRQPVVRGFDFIFATDPRNVDSSGKSYQHVAERAIAWAAKRGVVTASFHWKMGTYNASASLNKYNFYTSSTDFDPDKALVEGSAENLQFNRDLDTIAAELAKLRDAGVPVLWRPFHECSGGWFWWGAKGPATFKKLWLAMFDRFTRVHGLTNLLWVYNPTETGTSVQDWYPGDNYVDILSLDFYPATGTHPTYAAYYRQLVDFRSGRKLVALSENGGIPDPDALVSEGAWWSWFNTWNGDFLTDGTHNPESFLQKVYWHPRVLTLDSMPALYTAPAVLRQPSAGDTGTGARILLNAAVRGMPPLSYQWFKDGEALLSATSDTLVIASTSAADTGSYTLTITNALGSVTTEPACLSVANSAATPRVNRLANVSTRSYVSTGDGVLIAGFIIDGTGSKTLLLRALGPQLTQYQITSPLASPDLTLYGPAGLELAHNCLWQRNPDADALNTAAGSLGAPPLLSGNRDSALLLTLPPGAYTAILRGANDTSGVALIELYDLEPDAGSRLFNLSSRGTTGYTVNGSEEPLIAGFITAGSIRKRSLLRALGPALSGLGVSGAVSATRIDLRDSSQNSIATNSGWDKDSGQASLISEYTLGLGIQPPLPAGSGDSAIFLEQTGLLTALVYPNNSQAGIGMVEVFDADPAQGSAN